MAVVPNGSFIPKKTPAAGKRSGRAGSSGRTIGIFGYVSYILFFGVTLLAAGMLFISFQIENTLQEREQMLASVKNEFQQSDMDQVASFEHFLEVVEYTFDESFSVASIFQNIEESIAERAVLENLEITRDGKAGSRSLSIDAQVVTDSFDTALFQRDLYATVSVFDYFALNNVVLVRDGEAVDRIIQSGETGGGAISNAVLQAAAGSDAVNFNISIQMDPDSLPFNPQAVPPTGSPQQQTAPAPAVEVDTVDSDESEADAAEI